MKLRNKKTGEVIETDFELSISIPDSEKLYGNNTYTQIKGYSTIKELVDDWEDYTPADPLIKDEKIRKAVRAWAEAEGISVCRYKVPDTFESIDGTSKIEFGVFGFDEGRYTIAELCGEEEE